MKKERIHLQSIVDDLEMYIVYKIVVSLFEEIGYTEEDFVFFLEQRICDLCSVGINET